MILLRYNLGNFYKRKDVSVCFQHQHHNTEVSELTNLKLGPQVTLNIFTAILIIYKIQEMEPE